MTQKWNLDKKDEKTRKQKVDEEMTKHLIKSIYFKIWKCDNKMKIGQDEGKDENMIKWKDDAWLNIVDYDCRTSMDNPTCKTTTTMTGFW